MWIIFWKLESTAELPDINCKVEMIQTRKKRFEAA
jgi:hypothetical protein